MKGLDTVDCEPNCQWGFAPTVSDVEWVKHPTVSANGTLTLTVRPGKDDKLRLPGTSGGGASNVTLTNGRSKLYGFVIPPASPGWTWDPAPGQWIASRYLYDGLTLSVSARIPANAANQRDLTLCLWTGGRWPGNRVLGCVSVERP